MNNFKMMGALAGLMKNKDGLREAGERIQEKAAALRSVGQAGGGAVRAEVDGKMKVLSIQIEPALASGLAADEGSRAMAQDLIVEAVNDAMAKSQMAMRDVIAQEAQELGLGDLPADLGGLGGLLT